MKFVCLGFHDEEKFAQMTPEEADAWRPVSVHVNAENRGVEVERARERGKEPLLA